jgi:poly-D-alanine transfer protein DltD
MKSKKAVFTKLLIIFLVFGIIIPSVVFAQVGQNSNSVVSQWTEMCVKHYNDNFIKGQPLMHALRYEPVR